MKKLLISLLLTFSLAGCLNVELNRETLADDLKGLGTTNQVQYAFRCDYGVSSLSAPSARFQWDGVCVLLDNGFAFFFNNKETHHRELEFRLKHDDVINVALWKLKGKAYQIQMKTNVARISFNVSSDKGAFLDPALAQQMWDGIISQHYLKTEPTKKAIWDERGQIIVLPLPK